MVETEDSIGYRRTRLILSLWDSDHLFGIQPEFIGYSSVTELPKREHLEVVRKGSEAIRKWKDEHEGGLDLSRANLSGMNLHGAFLDEANLVDADLSGAKLSKAKLLSLWLTNAKLLGVDLSGSLLLGAFLIKADLRGANLSGARIWGGIFSGTELSNANFTNASMNATTIAACDLSKASGLETVKHEGMSFIDIWTLIKSFRGAGNHFTPELEAFFVNAGVPKEILGTIPRTLMKIEYCTAFICYGQPDLASAKKLQRELKARGVSCWLYPLDYTPGERTWKEIDLMRRQAEKMVVLCSSKSLIRDGVLKEIEDQIDEDADKVIPVSLDDLWKERGFQARRGDRDLKPFLLERNYVDFLDEPSYQESLDTLLRGLRRKT